MVLAAIINEEIVITNIKNQNVKECRRIECICNEIAKLGVDIQFTEDSITIKGKTLDDLKSYCKNKEIVINCYQDHRIAMSMSILASLLPEIIISDSICVNKTYPLFGKTFEIRYSKFYTG